MKNLRKALALLLCLCICLSLLPAAYAEEGGEDDFLVWEEEAAENADTAPVITAHPADVTAAGGTAAKMTVVASGEGLSYQWQYRTSVSDTWHKSGASGAKTKTISIAATTNKNGYQYRCIVSNAAGVVYSNAATLTVNDAAVTKPTITVQPANVSAPAGTQTNMSVTATGTNLTYQWQYRTSSSSAWKTSGATGAKTNKVSISVTAAKNGYQYRCIVSNAAGSTVSSVAAITVTSPGAKPTITTQPKSVTAAAGSTATMTVAASGAGLSYQWQYRTSASVSWQRSGTSGATTKTIKIAATTNKNGYQYRCIVSNSAGSVTSSAATLTVTGGVAAPVITTQPRSITVADGLQTAFYIDAVGTGLSYQWQYRANSVDPWTNITAASGTTDELTVDTCADINGYQYRCIVTNAGGTAYSKTATLTVATRPVILTQPESVTTPVDSTVTMSVEASGEALRYQWQCREFGTVSWRDSDDSGARTNSISINVTYNTVSSASSYLEYRCIVSNLAGTVYSNVANLKVTGLPTMPTITTQPKSISTMDGTTVTMTVEAAGGDLSYQWQYRTSSSASWRKSGTTGATTKTISIAAAANKNGYQYRCRISNRVGSVTSSAATLTVITLPTITAQPESVTAVIGSTETMTVAATGIGLSYQWQYRTSASASWRNSGTPGATTKTISITASEEKNGYQYHCIVSNSAGSVTSSEATLTVNTDIVAISKANFPDNTFRKYITNHYDLDKDGLLSKSEISEVTVLDCWYDEEMSQMDYWKEAGRVESAIYTLKGVELFTALTKLDCGGNQLRSLDVSKNTALTYLNCGGNRLTSLDVSRNTALTELRCYGNQLTNLDVSKNAALTRLICGEKQLTSLDVSKNTALTYLNCGGSGLTSLDVSKNTALTELWCSNIGLTSIDVSVNTALTVLSCSNNQLTSLDVSRNTALTKLRCDGNRLTNLDLSKNTELTQLWCENNQLTILDVSNCPKLTASGMSCDDVPIIWP